MSLAALTSEELEVIRRALLVAVRELDFEVHSRLGVSADAVDKIITEWPKVDDSQDDSDACLAVNNSLNDLLNGIGISDQVSQEELGVSRAELEKIYQKWAKARGWPATGVR